MMTWMNCFFQYLAIRSMVSVTASMITKKKIRFSGAFGFSKTSSPVSSKGFAIRMDRRWIITNSPPIRNMGKIAVCFSLLSLDISF
jgi:hypothetical protein